MGVVPARLLFLAFLGLSGMTIYNALYLQDQRANALIPGMESAAHMPSNISRAAVPPVAAPLSPVTTDLPPLKGQDIPEQLVRAVQRELKERGYDPGSADGKLRDDTRKAIASFEKDQGLPITGTPSDALLRQILLGVSVGTSSTGSVQTQVGDDGMTIKAVQQVLAQLGYSPGPVDGAMGATTAHAIIAFERDRKLTQDGKITAELLREIKRATGRDLLASRP